MKKWAYIAMAGSIFAGSASFPAPEAASGVRERLRSLLAKMSGSVHEKAVKLVSVARETYRLFREKKLKEIFDIFSGIAKIGISDLRLGTLAQKSHAVVAVFIEQTDTWGPARTRVGTGFVVQGASGGYYVVTVSHIFNNRFLEPNETVSVRFSAASKQIFLDAKLEAFEQAKDIAILGLSRAMVQKYEQEAGQTMPTLALGVLDPEKKGGVLHPIGYAGTVWSKGVTADIKPVIEPSLFETFNPAAYFGEVYGGTIPVLQLRSHLLRSAPGFSGAPIATRHGKVVGVQIGQQPRAPHVAHPGIEGVTLYATPIEYVERLIESFERRNPLSPDTREGEDANTQ